MARKPDKHDEYYERFAEQVIDQIRQGTAPWQKPWQPGQSFRPRNAVTGRSYNGGNSLYLAMAADRRGLSDSRWATYRQFQKAGGSYVMLAKGNRSAEVTAACRENGGFYLGSIGGPGARLAQDCITRVDCLEFPELGMEAVWSIEVRDFPAFIVVDDKGNDFFRAL